MYFQQRHNAQLNSTAGDIVARQGFDLDALGQAQKALTGSCAGVCRAPLSRPPQLGVEQTKRVIAYRAIAAPTLDF
jgi:hypothetical protein